MSHSSKSSFIPLSCYALLLCCCLISCSATRFVNIIGVAKSASAANVEQVHPTFQTAALNQNDLRPPTHGRNLLWAWSHWWPWNHHTPAVNNDTPTGSVDNNMTGTTPDVDIPGYESPATEPGSDVEDRVIEDGDNVGGSGVVCGVTVQNARTYYRGVRLSPPENSGSATQCCRRCRQTSGCDYWAFCDKDSGCATAGANSARLLKGQCELKKKEPEVLARGAGVDVTSGRNAASGGNRVSQTQTEVIVAEETTEGTGSGTGNRASQTQTEVIFEEETTEDLSGGQTDERGALLGNFETTDNNNNNNDNQRRAIVADESGAEAVEALEELLDADP